MPGEDELTKYGMRALDLLRGFFGDPNTGLGSLKLTQADQERLGRIAPALEVLDPNSGMGPLKLDPNRIQTQPGQDDRIDPNTGLQPFPAGGVKAGSFETNQ